MPIHEYACRGCGFATQGERTEMAACGTCGDPRGPGACKLN